MCIVSLLEVPTNNSLCKFLPLQAFMGYNACTFVLALNKMPFSLSDGPHNSHLTIRIKLLSPHTILV